MRKVFIGILCLCTLFVLSFGAYRGYKAWKQQRLLRQANEFLARADASSAILCVRQALDSNPSNIRATRMMAEFAEMAHSPHAVLWRNRLVELEPVLTNRLALARIALVSGDVALAQKTLDDLSEQDKNTAAYHKEAGALAIATKDFAAAEKHFSEIVRIEPSNVFGQLNLATLRLHKSDPEARGALRSLATNPAVRCEALRQLTRDAVRHTNFYAAFSFSKQIIAETNSVFADRLLHLDILCASSNQLQRVFLATLQQECQNNPVKAYELGKWLMNRLGSGMTLAWMNTLPETTRTNFPVVMVAADCYMVSKDWSALQTNLVNQNWYEMDCLRLACCSRAARERGLTASSQAQWLAALKAAQNRRDALLQLLALTRAWKWSQEEEDVLWAVFTFSPSDKWALSDLATRLYSNGRTRSLLTLYENALRQDGTNVIFLNNVAMIALLLDAWEKKPHEMAHDVYVKEPTNPPCVSTYAYSLLLQHRPEDALNVMQRLRAEDLKTPVIAAYYGLVLAGVGDPDKAQPYLDLAAKARLLPEEAKLIDRARKNH